MTCDGFMLLSLDYLLHHRGDNTCGSRCIQRVFLRLGIFTKICDCAAIVAALLSTKMLHATMCLDVYRPDGVAIVTEAQHSPYAKSWCVCYVTVSHVVEFFGNLVPSIKRNTVFG